MSKLPHKVDRFARPPGRRRALALTSSLRGPARFLAGVALLLLLGHPLRALAVSPLRSATVRAREDATRSIPFSKLDAETKAQISSVISHTSIFRRLPIQVTDCDPGLYQFLARHPEVIVNMWQVMGISKVTIKSTGPDSFRVSDGAGTRGNVRFCFSSDDTQLVYAEGAYEGPLFEKPVKAKCVLLLKSGYVQETNGRNYVTSRLDCFIQIEHMGLELLAKTFQSLIVKSADYNFIETVAFVGNVSRTAEHNPGGMSRLAKRLTHIEPELRERLVEIAGNISNKGQQPPGVMQAAARPIAEKSAPPKTK